MLSKNHIKHVLLLLIACSPLIYAGVIWNDIPEPTPLHYNSTGVDKVGTRMEFLWVIIFMTVVNIGVYLLLVNIHKIDPKRIKQGKHTVFNKVAAGTLLFITALSIVIIKQTLNPEKDLFTVAVLPIIGALFIFLGNMMYNIKPNYFAGIRIPWTLNDDENWKKTHRVGGALWFFGGILIILVSIFANEKAIAISFRAIIMILVIVPISYSYLLFRSKQKTSN